MEKLMILQISSGQGPVECELGVALLFQALKKEYPHMELLSCHPSREKGCFSSILFSAKQDLSCLEGSVQWICQSPYRPSHKRKNWFMDISVIPQEEMGMESGKMEEIRMETFHSSGKGGQNVNKVETGVRLIHLPTGITATSTAERSQHANRRDALKKLNGILADRKKTADEKQVKTAWMEHNKIVRGNPVRIYEGIHFKKKF